MQGTATTLGEECFLLNEKKKPKRDTSCEIVLILQLGLLTLRSGLESLSYLAPRIWEMLPSDLNKTKALSKLEVYNKK